MARFNCILLLAIVWSVGAGAYAQLPPILDRARQDSAEEALIIVPIDVNVKKDTRADRVTVTAMVAKVIHSASGLKPDQEIKLRYSIYPKREGASGASLPLPLLEKDVQVHAFLGQSDPGMFRSAADGLSFTPLIDVNADAPEKLTVHVTSVQQKEGSGEKIVKVTAAARVTAVAKTSSNLKPGDEIQIAYLSSTDPLPALALPPIANQNADYDVALKPDPRGKSYAFYADKWSLEPLAATTQPAAP